MARTFFGAFLFIKYLLKECGLSLLFEIINGIMVAFNGETNEKYFGISRI